jgi:lipopolysaccharide transport system permease protein
MATRSTSDVLVASATPASLRTGFPRLVADGIADLRTRGRLVRYLVGADMKRTHADTVIGQLWWVLDPLLQVAVFYLVFDIIFKRQIPDFLLYLLATILAWKWFSTTLNDAMGSIVNRQGLIRQLPFPKIVLPTSSTLAGTVSFFISLSALLFVYPLYLSRLTPWVLLIPLIAFVQFVFTLALAVVLSAANAFYRDVSNTMGHVLRLWFYLSPILYDVGDLNGHHVLTQLFHLNPFVTILESYRAVIWGTRTGPGTAPDFVGLGVILLVSIVLLVIAIAIFKRVEPSFARIL